MKNLEKLVFEKLKDYPERIGHIKGVIKVSEELAKLYGVDIREAKLAALFHDFTKYDDIKSQLKYLDKEVIDKYKDYPFIYHAYSAANYLRQLLPDLNEDVYNAVKYHIWGREGMSTLEKIILISDKCEPNRKYIAAKKIYEIALKDLDQGVVYTLETMNEHLLNQNIKIHPEQLKTYNYYAKEKI